METVVAILFLAIGDTGMLSGLAMPMPDKALCEQSLKVGAAEAELNGDKVQAARCVTGAQANRILSGLGCLETSTGDDVAHVYICKGLPK